MMPNPSGPYPGRQLFLGLTVETKPCFAYLVTGRSPESRQRKAVLRENTAIMGPLGDAPYDPLRHYTAVKYDRASGVIAVTNGIQTEAIFEAYKLLFNVNTPPTKDYLEKLMEGANFEPDSLHTPRISGAITGGGNPLLFISIKTHLGPAVAHQLTLSVGSLGGVSTYKGNLDNPEPTDPKAPPSQIKFAGKTPQDLAKHLWDMSAANYKGEDIRVCTLGGICSADSWEIAIINRY
jgi:IMP cyclohydrolase